MYIYKIDFQHTFALDTLYLVPIIQNSVVVMNHVTNVGNGHVEEI